MHGGQLSKGGVARLLRVVERSGREWSVWHGCPGMVMSKVVQEEGDSPMEKQRTLRMGPATMLASTRGVTR